jgi:putative restriction endonuclease
VSSPDLNIRLRAFDWLTQQREERGETLSRRILESFEVAGRRVPLVGPSGIWKPAACELPLSITTSFESPYSDVYEASLAAVQYSYRGTDIAHRDNVGLRRAMAEHVPLVYFLALAPGKYAAAYPAFVVGDDPAKLEFKVQIDDAGASLTQADPDEYAIADSEPRRAYVTATVQRRLHQLAFRQRVLRAYGEQCALCRLRHTELLDAAHITPDRAELGEPVVQNGMSLCKLHHAAFDRFFFTVRTDYVVEVRESILRETDGPMLIVGLQQIHGLEIHLPARPAERPDRDRLERRYREFQSQSAT